MTDEHQGRDPGAPAQGMASAHDAIRSRGQDRLRRVAFAERIASQLRLAPFGSSSVLAVTGPWGSGKTSVLNMITEALPIEAGVVVLEFNPWLFSSPEELVRTFFDELSAELTQESQEESLRIIGQALQRYGRRLSPLRFVPVVGGLVDAVASGMETAGRTFEEAGTPEQLPSLRAQHKQLAGLLRSSTDRLVIVVDDLDRLRRDEIREVLRLVRLTADLPNISYLLAFDRSVVEAALTDIEPDGEVYLSGRGYLEKIIHELYDLPRLHDSDRETLLMEGLERVTHGVSHGPFDAYVFQNVFHRSLKHLFATIRDVNRYLSVLPVALNETGSEIALTDLLALEAMRVLLPSSYGLLPVASEALTAIDDSAGPSVDGRRAIFTKFIASAGDKANLLEALCFDIFPATQRYSSNRHSSPEQLGGWRKGRRAAHPDVLRLYLQRSLPESAVPTATVQMAVSLLASSLALDELLMSLSDDHLLDLMDRLEDYENVYPVEHIEPAIFVLLKQYKRWPRRPGGPFTVDPRMRLTRVVLRLIRRIDEDLERLALVQHVLPRLKSLSARYILIELVGHREGAGHRLVPLADYQRLIRALAEETLDASIDQLVDERDLVILLSSALSEGGQSQDSVRDRVKDPRILAQVLTSAVRTIGGWNMTDVETTPTLAIPWPEMEKLVGVDTLMECLPATMTLIRADRSTDESAVSAAALADQWINERTPSVPEACV